MALSLAELERLRREQAILNAPIEAVSQPGTQVSEMITPEGAELIPPKDYAWFNRKRGEEGIYATPPTIMDAAKHVIPFGREIAGEKPIDMDTAMEAVMWAPAIKPVAVIGKQVGKVIGRQIAKEAPELKAIAKNVLKSNRGAVGIKKPQMPEIKFPIDQAERLRGSGPLTIEDQGKYFKSYKTGGGIETVPVSKHSTRLKESKLQDVAKQKNSTTIPDSTTPDSTTYKNSEAPKYTTSGIKYYESDLGPGPSTIIEQPKWRGEVGRPQESIEPFIKKDFKSQKLRSVGGRPSQYAKIQDIVSPKRLKEIEKASSAGKGPSIETINRDLRLKGITPDRARELRKQRAEELLFKRERRGTPELEKLNEKPNVPKEIEKTQEGTLEYKKVPPGEEINSEVGMGHGERGLDIYVDEVTGNEIVNPIEASPYEHASINSEYTQRNLERLWGRPKGSTREPKSDKWVGRNKLIEDLGTLDDTIKEAEAQGNKSLVTRLTKAREAKFEELYNQQVKDIKYGETSHWGGYKIKRTHPDRVVGEDLYEDPWKQNPAGLAPKETEKSPGFLEPKIGKWNPQRPYTPLKEVSKERKPLGLITQESKLSEVALPKLEGMKSEAAESLGAKLDHDKALALYKEYTAEKLAIRKAIEEGADTATIKALSPRIHANQMRAEMLDTFIKGKTSHYSLTDDARRAYFREKAGIKIEHDPKKLEFRALNKEGKEIGAYEIEPTEGGFKTVNISVSPEYQKHGIAEEMVRRAEKEYGELLGSTTIESEEGEAFFKSLRNKKLTERARRLSGIGPGTGEGPGAQKIDLIRLAKLKSKENERRISNTTASKFLRKTEGEQLQYIKDLKPLPPPEGKLTVAQMAKYRNEQMRRLSLINQRNIQTRLEAEKKAIAEAKKKVITDEQYKKIYKERD